MRKQPIDVTNYPNQRQSRTHKPIDVTNYPSQPAQQPKQAGRPEPVSADCPNATAERQRLIEQAIAKREAELGRPLDDFEKDQIANPESSRTSRRRRSGRAW